MGPAGGEATRDRPDRTRTLREYPGCVVALDFPGGSGPLLRSSFHEALEVDRAVLAGEMALCLPQLFQAGNRRILPHLPTGIGPKQAGIAPGGGERDDAVPVRRDTGEERL